MTPLEALDKINTMFLAFAPRDIREDKELNEDLFSCIKSVIEENKKLKNINHELVKEKERLYLENILNEEARIYLYKKLEALEIIKVKNVNSIDIRCCDTVEQYNAKENGNTPLTKEEYELLKKELL